MGLVDYSDSDSDGEAATIPEPSTQSSIASGSKKPAFQKVVDRSKPGKILVNLPGSSSGQDSSNTTTNGDEPPAKRARTSKGGAFSGFNSFLPPPKNVGKKPAASTASGSGSSGVKGTNAPRPGVHLKTGAAPAFSRNSDEEFGDGTNAYEQSAPGGDGGMSLPAPKSQQPTIPAGQKSADEVELVGKPLMFRPLSVARKKPTKKPTTKSTTTATTTSTSAAATASAPVSMKSTTPIETANVEPPPKKKISLFSISDEPTEEPKPAGKSNSEYEPLIDTDAALEPSTASAFAEYDAQYSSYAAPSQATTVSSTSGDASHSLDNIVNDMNLSAAARRELFGRRGAPSAASAATKVINFDTEREYAHNEVLRASGEQQTHNPVRAIAPGKHNLRQLVNQVQSQRDALEENFAKNKAKQSEAGSRYGWR
ncbi:mitotic checkpoint regulator, MAD2B-interacting-domain-containing protein [Xylaria bambusicola]|uniref:mitotic checkpoint regulator, MAD2B-interacting-domain-containing protein n=1 Tax=Xylaria bambusicola TaxID=326684 RepID=UPI002008BAC8|nr:mitotic checkpoint regulator, MAD2B-interacting-domain-containing protein [Xylaria bambusicola]KAI0506738.1 mitotic checkpoint regulator, MAD2B-interacting-domain-containing protein [Xylaria bambusicola]